MTVIVALFREVFKRISADIEKKLINFLFGRKRGKRYNP